jgi:hypothetical protein
MVPSSGKGFFPMKKVFVSCLSLSLILVSCTSSQLTATPPRRPDPITTPWEDRSIFKSGLVESQQSILDELGGASVYHIQFKIAEEIYNLTGHQEVQYTNTETIALNEVQFRLFPNILGGKMDVSNLRVDEQSITPKYELNNSLMIVPLSAPLEPGKSVVFKMDFAVTVPQDVEQNYGMLAYFEDVLALAHAYPMIAVYDDEGWNAEIPSQDGDITYGDAAFFIVKVTAPKGLTLVTSGSEISHNEDEQTQALSVASGPARDFYLAASAIYEETSQTLGEVTIRSYAPAKLKDGAKMALDVSSKSIELFSSLYAPYPYTELDIISTPTLAGGIEYPGLIVITSGLYDIQGNSPASRSSMEGVVAHEVGHQWFYNLVGDDQLDDPWLDEALAQFATLEYFADQYGRNGEDGFRAHLESRWERLDHAKIPISLPVAAYEGGAYGPIVYGRGPLFFVALREEMGDAVFDQFLRDYTERLSWKIATPEFLQSLAEEHCSCDLDALFQEWVYP